MTAEARAREFEVLGYLVGTLGSHHRITEAVRLVVDDDRDIAAEIERSLRPRRLWRVSDKHGLCVVEEGDDGRLVADLTPNLSWTPEARSTPPEQLRAWAEEIVALHNAVSAE